MTIHRTTTVSAKGQVVLPKATRSEMGWEAGTKLRVRQTPEGILLSPEHAFAETNIEAVFGCLTYAGPAKSVEEMDAAVMNEARRRE